MLISEETRALASKAEARCAPIFAHIDQVAQGNSEKLLEAFQTHRVSAAHLVGTTGYGYDDLGRDTLDKIFAQVFRAEAGLVRTQFVNGTHTITCALMGILRPGDLVISAFGAPYDTLQGVIGVTGNAPGNMLEMGIQYRQVDMTPDLRPDIPGIQAAVQAPNAKLLMIQRSRGYSVRDALTVREIGEIIAAAKAANPEILVFVDNCYGEFVEAQEPTEVGADIMAGSLIKNPGGGIAPTGGYIVGRADLVEAAAMRLTCPGIGRECGCSQDANRLLYQGFFLAPHVTAQALKTAVFCAAVMEDQGYVTSPRVDAVRGDIVQTVELRKPELLRAFCRGVQMGAPVDSYVTPEPWDMPGYEDQVIMAAGAFVQGASIELSADGPMREPYMAYLQGGITYESGRLGILLALEQLRRAGGTT
jgi:cystathionine beta-lyase family protein involved in aluminum resistance